MRSTSGHDRNMCVLSSPTPRPTHPHPHPLCTFFYVPIGPPFTADRVVWLLAPQGVRRDSGCGDCVLLLCRRMFLAVALCVVNRSSCAHSRLGRASIAHPFSLGKSLRHASVGPACLFCQTTCPCLSLACPPVNVPDVHCEINIIYHILRLTLIVKHNKSNKCIKKYYVPTKVGIRMICSFCLS